jgi:hypothetical protein
MQLVSLLAQGVTKQASFGQKGLDKILCFRCELNGHFAQDCTDVLYVYCEKASHVASECPLLSMPKPIAVTYGLCRPQLMFNEVLDSPDIRFKHDSGKVGRITVEEGVMMAAKIIKEMEWIVPGDHQWDLRPAGDNSFKVVFPCKADLTRLKNIANIPIEGTKMYLHFEEWSAADLDKFANTRLWGRVNRCPYKERCDYLTLFVVGSLIGKAVEVDMAFTRERSIVRMLVDD